MWIFDEKTKAKFGKNNCEGFSYAIYEIENRPEVGCSQNMTENLTKNLTKNLTQNLTQNMTKNVTQNVTHVTQNMSQNMSQNKTRDKETDITQYLAQDVTQDSESQWPETKAQNKARTLAALLKKTPGLKIKTKSKKNGHKKNEHEDLNLEVTDEHDNSLVDPDKLVSKLIRDDEEDSETDNDMDDATNEQGNLLRGIGNKIIRR